MNYALLSKWIEGRVEDLVAMGVPRDEAGELMRSVEFGAIASEAGARSEDQFLLDLKRCGGEVMATRHGVTRQAVNRRKTKLLAKRAHRLTAQLTGT